MDKGCNPCFNRTAVRAGPLRLIFPIMILLSFRLFAAWSQAQTLPSPSDALAGAAPNTVVAAMPGVRAAGITLGSTELQTPGESPVILPLGGTLSTGTSPRGQAGIPLASIQLSNPGVSPPLRFATPNGCTVSTTSNPAGGALPARLFDGNAGRSMGAGIGASNACTNSGLSTAQQGVVTQGKTGIGFGATELTNNGLADAVSVQGN